MNKLFVAATAVFAMAGTAAIAAPAPSSAEPMRLDAAQLDDISAGLNLNIAVAVPTQVTVPTAVAIAVGDNAVANARNHVIAVQVTRIRQRNVS